MQQHREPVRRARAGFIARVHEWSARGGIDSVVEQMPGRNQPGVER